MGKYIFLAIIVILSILSKNKVMLYASVTLIILSLLPSSDKTLVLSKKHGIKIGLYFLTLAILTPIAMGHVSMQDIVKSFLDYKSIIATVFGIIAAILSTRGIQLQLLNPQIVISVSIGTIIGISLFGGTASGPIIASGLTFVVLQIIDKFK